MPQASPQVTGPEEAPKPAPLFGAAILACLGAAVLALFLFAWLGSEVLQGDTQHFDQVIRECGRKTGGNRRRVLAGGDGHSPATVQRRGCGHAGPLAHLCHGID